jgi:hypothetical protein
MSLDLQNDYSQVSGIITSIQSYNQALSELEKSGKDAGSAFESAAKNTVASLNSIKSVSKSFQKDVKSQYEQLLSLMTVLNGQGQGTVDYIKLTFIKILTTIEPILIEILQEVSLEAVGCSHQQSFVAQPIWIPVKSIDLGNLLKVDPDSDSGKTRYEKKPIDVNSFPFSMNRELWNRINKSGLSFHSQYSKDYIGASGQPLFDIEHTTTGQFGETGSFFKVTLKNRVNNVNNVFEFMTDYYATLNKVEIQGIMASIMDSLCGAISIDANVGLSQASDQTKFSLIIQRILGLCFDNRKEIDVSGVAKVSEVDGVDNSFFEFTEIDLRKIDQTISNIKLGVVEFEDCNNVKLPVDSKSIIDSINNLLHVEGDALVNAANQVSQTLSNNPKWNGLALDVNVKLKVETDFIKLIINGLTFSLLSPKILLPIMIMVKSIQQKGTDSVSFVEFAKKFKSFIIKLVSKIGAIFIKKLFEIVSRDIIKLLKIIIGKISLDEIEKRTKIILKLVQLLIAISDLISDYRSCKSIIDKILRLLGLVTGDLAPPGFRIPLPLLFASNLLAGYSQTRALNNVIENMQKYGLPTQPNPDGSPNQGIIFAKCIIDGMAKEQFENGKTDVAIPPLQIPTPVGPLITIPTQASGKWL